MARQQFIPCFWPLSATDNAAESSWCNQPRAPPPTPFQIYPSGEGLGLIKELITTEKATEHVVEELRSDLQLFLITSPRQHFMISSKCPLNFQLEKWTAKDLVHRPLMSLMSEDIKDIKQYKLESLNYLLLNQIF